MPFMSVRQRTLMDRKADRVEFTILHQTTYRYPGKIHESYSIVRLRPRSDATQYCTKYELNVAPRARIFSYVDRFGNHDTLIDDRFARIAVGRDYRDVSPVSGVYKGASGSSMSVNVAMEALAGTQQQQQ
jgi:transglutaminase-like putative cysteine protease